MDSDAPVFAPFLRPLVERGIIAGAVALAADRGEVRAVEALGHADLASRRLMDGDDVFWIASTTKALTGTLVTMLIEEGHLDPHDCIEKYLPEFHGQMVVAEQDDDHRLLKRPSHPITLLECLTHTSGLAFRSPVEEPTLDALPLATAVRSHAMMPLLTEPGTVYQYSNAGTNTAARLVEVVTGRAFEDFLQERLLDPLGMRETTFWPDDERVVSTYRLTGTDDAPGALEKKNIGVARLPLADRTRRYAFPAGGLFSTARDLAKFGRMIANGGALDGRRYLSEASVREMTARHTPATVAGAVGYLWKCDGGLWGHDGAYRNQFLIEPRSGVIFVLMVQSVGAGGPAIAEAAAACQRAAVARFG